MQIKRNKNKNKNQRNKNKNQRNKTKNQRHKTKTKNQRNKMTTMTVKACLVETAATTHATLENRTSLNI